MTEKKGREISFTVGEILANVRPTPQVDNGLDENQKLEAVKRHFTEIMKVLGLDLQNDSLEKTPERVAKMYVKELFQGLNDEHFPKITVIENEMKYDQMVLVKDVNVMSVCEHHFVTIDGVANIAYIPKKRVIGLSKINRITKFFSRRPQVQERLTKQIADCLAYVLDTSDVAVQIAAKHYCVVSRGIEDINSKTITSDLRGVFRTNSETRSEFYSQIQYQ